MIARIRRWIRPLFSGFKSLGDNYWKYSHYTTFPDNPYYFEAFKHYPNLPHEKRFEQNWEVRK